MKRILKKGSQRALILKSADRISNMISLGYVTAPEFIERTCDDTEKYVLEMALMVDYNMCQELISLFVSRYNYLNAIGYFDKKRLYSVFSCKNFFTSATR